MRVKGPPQMWLRNENLGSRTLRGRNGLGQGEWGVAKRFNEGEE